MTSSLIVCPSCGKETSGAEASCAWCGALLAATVDLEFEALSLDEGARATRRLPIMSEAEAHLSDGTEAGFEPLDLDPSHQIVAPPIRHPAQGAAMPVLIGAAGLWAIAEWRIATTDDWGVWEPIWYVTAVLTIVLGMAMGILMWRAVRDGRSWADAFRLFLP